MSKSLSRLSTGVALSAAIVLTLYAVVVPMVIPHDDQIVDFFSSGLPPSSEHWFGTDSAGRDLFVRVALGLRISILIASVVALLATALGVTVGVVAGFFGGRTDHILMRFADTVNALPHMVLGLVIVAMFRGSIVAIIIALVISHWVTSARIVRAQTLPMRRSDLLSSAWVSGMGPGRIMLHHVLPAVSGQTFIAMLLLLPHAVWHESAFSFLGVGLAPHQASLGTLLRDAQGGILLGQWWLLVFPAGALIVITLAVGAIGHAWLRRITQGESDD